MEMKLGLEVHHPGLPSQEDPSISARLLLPNEFVRLKFLL
jgi:hypothetical protein